MTETDLGKQELHPTHETRFSFDASSWDEICVFCGHTDIAGGGWGALAKPCTATPEMRDQRRWDNRRSRTNDLN